MFDRKNTANLHIHDALKVATGTNLREQARDRLEIAQSIWTMQRDLLRREASVPLGMQERLRQQREHMQRQRDDLEKRFGAFGSRAA